MNMNSLDQAIEDFNNWNGAAWLYYNRKEDYFNTEVFYNDVGMSQTVLSDDCFVILSKSERDNRQIGDKRRAYIEDFMRLISEGLEPYQASYNLLEKYPAI